MIRRGDL